MDAGNAAEASRLLFTCWRAREVMAALPEAVRPQSRAEGYAIQALLPARAGAGVFGWKVAASSVAGQRHINVDGPLAGRILTTSVRPDGGTVSIRGNRMRVAEMEFAFRMGRTLAPRAARYEIDETLDAVASLHPAIESPDSRFDDFTAVGAAQLIADAACADLFVLGPATEADWRRIDLAGHEVSAVDGRGGLHTGVGANVLGDPRVSLAWLVNELSSIGVALEAGQVVTTGTCMTPIPVQPGDRVRGDFGVIGKVSATFEG